MVIAVHDNLKGRNDCNSEHKFIQNLIQAFYLKYPEVQFYFIGKNADTVKKDENRFIGIKEPRFPFLRKKRYDKKIAKVLENIGADQFISNDGYYCNETRIPQFLIIHETFDLERLRKMDFEKVKSVIVLSESTGTKLISTLKLDSGKIKNIHFGINSEIQPLNFEEQFIIKEDHTEGKEYFLASYPNDKNVLISLLKAFSIFKKRQQTNMMLLIISDNREVSDSFYSIVQNYKYKQEVILKFRDGTKKDYNFLGAAYAYINLSLKSLIEIGEAMKSGVPVMTTENAREITGNAALYLQPLDQQQIADQLMLLYKDEDLRSELIKNSSTIISEYTWERTAEFLWKAMKM